MRFCCLIQKTCLFHAFRADTRDEKNASKKKQRFSAMFLLTFLGIQAVGATENMFTYIVQLLENGIASQPFFPYHADTSYCGKYDKVHTLTHH